MAKVAKDLQWKYQNNKIVGEGYLRAEITAADCPDVGSEYYVATLPEGAILLGMTAFIDGVELPTTKEMGITVDIGMNDCQFCMHNDLTMAAGKNIVCTDNCKCTIADQDYLIRVTLKDVLDEGRIVLLVHIILPEQIICEAEPVKLCYENTIVDPCTGECGCEATTCGPIVVSTVVASTPASAPVDGEVTGTVTLSNTGTTAAQDVTVNVDLPAGYKPGTEKYSTNFGTYNPSTNVFSVPRLAAGDTAVLTITGKLKSTIKFDVTRATSEGQENTSVAGSDTLTATTTKS